MTHEQLLAAHAERIRRESDIRELTRLAQKYHMDVVGPLKALVDEAQQLGIYDDVAVKAAFVEGFCAAVVRPERGTEDAWQASQASATPTTYRCGTCGMTGIPALNVAQMHSVGNNICGPVKEEHG